jgi:hypothetical protein
MTSPEPTPPPSRNKLIGRIVILAFGVLLLVYFVPLAISVLWPQR